MAGHRRPGRLTRRQRIAVASLARGSTNAEAAEAARVGLRTVERWRGFADFDDALDREAAAALDEHRDRMRALVFASRDAVAARIAEGGPRAAGLAARVLLSSHVASFALGDGAPGVEHVEQHGTPAPRPTGPVLVGPDDPGWTEPPGAGLSDSEAAPGAGAPDVPAGPANAALTAAHGPHGRES